MRRKESFYAVVGGCVGTVLTLMVCSLSPLEVQSRSDGNFDKITCRELNIIDSEENIGIRLYAYRIEEGLVKPLKGYSMKMFDVEGNNVIDLNSGSMTWLTMLDPGLLGEKATLTPLSIRLNTSGNRYYTEVAPGEINLVATGEGYSEVSMTTTTWDGKRSRPIPSVYTMKGTDSETAEVYSELK